MLPTLAIITLRSSPSRESLLPMFKGGMKLPTGITIDGNNVLYVSNNHFVSMFDTSGKFLGKFGKEVNWKS